MSAPATLRSGPRAEARRRWVALSVAAGAFAMLGLSFAAVPLYDLFCRVTGYGGTTQVATAAPQARGTRDIRVRFDANVAPGLGWRFESETATVTLRAGETKTVFYKVTNTGKTASTGIASYNVAPEAAGGFFNKIACFCFTEQTLEAGESMDMPVVFFLDPDLEKDERMRGVADVTLSYTFFAAKTQPKAGAAQLQPAASPQAKGNTDG
ncbi:MAG: cytochrome c oxidase assembly protein [Methylobacteriaceae bacterium]|nr:cytochrome c oxidase assembly protein [Methylobacteriaceae bacterium]